MSLKDPAAKLSPKDDDEFGSGEVEESSTDSEDEVADDDTAELSELSDDGAQAESGMDFPTTNEYVWDNELL